MTERTRWYLLPLVAALAVAPMGQAGAQSISFGVMAGGSLSTFTGDFATDVKQYAGFIGGAFVHIGLAGFAAQPGIYYTTKGVKSDQFYGTAKQQTLDYIQIPLVVRLTIGPVYVGGGPAIGFKIGCKLGSPGTTGNCGSFTRPDPKSTEISGIGEAGLSFGKVSLGVRADLGLSDVFNGPVNNINVRTRTLSAVVEVRF
ncbi:MAG: outer membrane beta-barrel protein [Gemmatimonadales bacterium]